MAQRQQGEAFGVFDSEARILAMNEAGHSARCIAARLFVDAAYVAAVVNRYGFAALGAEMSRQEAAIRSADRAFQLVLAASGGRFT